MTSSVERLSTGIIKPRISTLSNNNHNMHDKAGSPTASGPVNGSEFFRKTHYFINNKMAHNRQIPITANNLKYTE